MQILRNEIRTGILVVLTMGLTIGVVLYLSAPGLFRPLRRYYVYFDDAAAIKPGSAVMLAGRKIGTVADIRSPVPWRDRPNQRKELEALIVVEVDAAAEIYKKTAVSMRSFGLLAELVIDFNSGDPDSGRAVNLDRFVGARAPDLSEVGSMVLAKLDPTLKATGETLTELQRASRNLTELTSKNSRLVGALVGTIESYRKIGENLTQLTGPDGMINSVLKGAAGTLADFQKLSSQFTEGNRVGRTLGNFDDSARELKRVLVQFHGTLDTTLPRVESIITDLSDLSGKLRSQPWRIIWPATARYPEREQSSSRKLPRVSRQN